MHSFVPDKCQQSLHCKLPRNLHRTVWQVVIKAPLSAELMSEKCSLVP